jgi:hypothetical protein
MTAPDEQAAVDLRPGRARRSITLAPVYEGDCKDANPQEQAATRPAQAAFRDQLSQAQGDSANFHALVDALDVQIVRLRMNDATTRPIL